MIYLAVVIYALLAFIAWREYRHEGERVREQEAFIAERETWGRERRDLLNRIQVPEAAPFMDDGSNDLPTLPEMTLNEEEVEQARQALEDVGYSEGPVA